MACRRVWRYDSRMRLEPRQLIHLLAVARTGSFVRASETLNLSQPALSASISRLEDVMGLKLLERGPRGAILTPAGAVITRHAESLETLLDRAVTEAMAAASGISGSLAVAGTPLATNSIIPAIVARLALEAAPATISIGEGPNEELVRLLERHEIDFAIGAIGAETKPPGVEEIPLFKARSVVVVRADHRLASSQTLSLHELTHELWVLPSSGKYREHLEAIFAAVGLRTPAHLISASPFGVIKQLLRQTEGLTVLSDQIVGQELALGALVAIPLAEPIAVRGFGLQFLADRPLSALALRFKSLAIELGPQFDLSSGPYPPPERRSPDLAPISS